jgi:hypothetical protein
MNFKLVGFAGMLTGLLVMAGDYLFGGEPSPSYPSTTADYEALANWWNSLSPEHRQRIEDTLDDVEKGGNYTPN